MTFETVITEMFERIPEMRLKYESEFDYMEDEEPLAYPVFATLLIPTLESALEQRDLRTILSICAYLEDVAQSDGNDRRLGELLRIELGEWLGWAPNEEFLSPWLGAETKRICGYVPGLAMQRRFLRQEQQIRRLKNRISTLFKKLRSKW